jgi:para-aminobenzoate synthetase component 2
MILVVDNYDSFVHNVARYLTTLGARCDVVRNDALTVPDIRAMRPDAIVISPGPCTPAEAGISCAVIEELSGEVPLLGVCLGHQCLGAVHGLAVGPARRPLHGQSSRIVHDGQRLFSGLSSPLLVGRYHSLIVEEAPAGTGALIVDARSEEGEIMALSHREHPTYGVQFHPESILSPQGRAMFQTFLRLANVRVTDAVA